MLSHSLESDRQIVGTKYISALHHVQVSKEDQKKATASFSV